MAGKNSTPEPEAPRKLPDGMDEVLLAIAKANNHPHPENWAATVLLHYVYPDGFPQGDETSDEGLDPNDPIYDD